MYMYTYLYIYILIYMYISYNSVCFITNYYKYYIYTYYIYIHIYIYICIYSRVCQGTASIMVYAIRRVLDDNINIKGAYYSNIKEVSLPQSAQ